MPNFEESLKQELLAANDEFRSLHEHHQDLEKRLDLLRERELLSEADEFEEKRIKREKLFLKDRMEAILRSRRESGVST